MIVVIGYYNYFLVMFKLTFHYSYMKLSYGHPDLSSKLLELDTDQKTIKV